MIRPRLIPILLIQDGGLVKGVNFKKHVYVGDPVNVVKIFNEKEVDEIAILDISCTVENRDPNYELISEITSEAFMPLSYGGGLKSIEQVRKIFHSGVEKVIFNTSAYLNPNLIKETAKEFGSSSTVVSIDVKTSGFFKSTKKVFIQNSRKQIELTPLEYSKMLVDLGAGEIILTSVDHEGLMAGYDNDLIEEITSNLEIPVVANGGAGNMDHFKQALNHGASAVAAGSFFVFQGTHKAVLITYPSYSDFSQII
nr:AglZ/HisF2 family acetamidino modification protein [Pedobacter panaciterrae]